MAERKIPAKVYIYFQDDNIELIEEQDIKQLSLLGISDLYTYNLDYISYEAFEYKQCRSAILEIYNGKELYKRVKKQYIAMVRIIKRDNTEDIIQVPWKSKKKNKRHNKYQKVTIDKQNNDVKIEIIAK